MTAAQFREAVLATPEWAEAWQMTGRMHRVEYPLVVRAREAGVAWTRPEGHPDRRQMVMEAVVSWSLIGVARPGQQMMNWAGDCANLHPGEVRPFARQIRDTLLGVLGP